MGNVPPSSTMSGEILTKHSEGSDGLYRGILPYLPPFYPDSTLLLQISVNASILSASGGTCVCTGENLCVADTDYLLCVNDVRNDLITSTAAISALSSFLMGAVANLPIGMAPGLGLNGYVRDSVSVWDTPSSELTTLHPYSLPTQLSASTAPAQSHTVKLYLPYSWRGMLVNQQKPPSLLIDLS
jgi:hypothetical protein